MKAAVLLFPGSNRERDVARALEQAGMQVEIVWHGADKLPVGADLAVLPGGFSYGDYLRCGAIAARARVMAAVSEHAARGGLVLGICNGFQILCEAGLLPGALMRNAGLKFICRMQTLRVETVRTPFTRGYAAGAVVTYALAHGEGAYMAAPEEIAALESSGPRRVPLLRRGGRARLRPPTPMARSPTSPESAMTAAMFSASCRIPKT